MKTVLCKIIGHDYQDTNKNNSLFKEFECKNCNQQFTTDGYGRIVKLTSFWKENHLSIEKYFQKI